jgi:hypothetical protein
VRDYLPIGGVVGALDAHHLRRQTSVMFLHVVHELSLRHGRTQDQDLVGARELVGDGGEESVLVIGVIARPHLGRPLVTVKVLRGGFQRLLVEGGADMKDPRLVLVQPNCHVTHDVSVQQYPAQGRKRVPRVREPTGDGTDD